MVLDAWDETANGGVVSTRRFTDLLRRQGHMVTVVSTGAPARGKVRLERFRVPLADRIMREMRFPFAWPDRRILTETFARQDVVHVQFPFLLGIRAISIARQAGLPVVSTFHVQAEHLLHNVGIRSPALVDLVYRFFLRTTYDRSDRVICPSEFAAQEIRAHGLRAPAVVISNGVPPEYRPLPRAACPDFGGRIVLLSVGRLAREKRHDLLLEAVRRSRHEARIQVVILGAGPLRAALEARGRGLTNRPVFDFLPPGALVPWYGAADLVVHASEIEVEGMSVLEAMACGAPCLIARAPKSATPQFALSDDFLFAAGSVEALSVKLDHLLDRPAMLADARPASRQAAEAYRIERSLERLVRVYQEVTAGATSRTASGNLALPPH
jgi:1,2-diacylglycerol 3-alpha-glucosyltransferase